MIKLFHTADIHIGARNKYLGDKLFHLQKKFLKRLYNDAKREGVRYVVIAGDIFDSNFVISSMVKEFFEIVISNEDIYTVIIPGGGNVHEKEIIGHDAYTKDSVYLRPDVRLYLKNDNIVFLSPDSPSQVVDNIAFYGGFFEIPDLPRLDARYHIGVVHGPFSERPEYGEIPVSELEKLFFDYICLGHYHSFKRFNKCAYSGPLVQFEFSKKKDVSSGYVKVILDDGVNIDYQMFYDAPSFYKKDIMGLDDINLVLDRANKGHFVEITGYYKELKPQIEEILGNNNIKLSDDVIEYEKDGIYGIIEECLDDILSSNMYIEKDIADDIRSFILKSIRGNLTKPRIEEFLKNKFLL